MKIMLLALLLAAKDINIVNSTGKSIDSKLCEIEGCGLRDYVSSVSF